MKPMVGDDIMFVMPGGVELAAKITHVWPNTAEDLVNCVVFGNGREERDAVRLRTSVPHDGLGESIHTWHYRDTSERDGARFSEALRSASAAVSAPPLGLQTFTKGE